MPLKKAILPQVHHVIVIAVFHLVTTAVLVRGGCPKDRPNTCESDYFGFSDLPADKNCYSDDMICDGIVFCENLSDEKITSMFYGCSECKGGSHTCTASQWGAMTFECVAKSRFCDGVNDCDKGDDEEDCSTCPSDRPQKVQGSTCCVREGDLCNGKPDCKDGSDENDCGESCASDLFMCSNGNCKETNKICDGRDDCGDNSDETSCSTCGDVEGRPFKCGYSSKCIENSKVCDKNMDCSDGSDEQDCTEVVQCTDAAPYRPESSNTCCITKEQLCDGHSDCDDNSDENYFGECCPKCCPRERPFRCSDLETKCIQQSSVCDGRQDCQNGEDESNCQVETTTTTTMRPRIQSSSVAVAAKPGQSSNSKRKTSKPMRPAHPVRPSRPSRPAQQPHSTASKSTSVANQKPPSVAQIPQPSVDSKRNGGQAISYVPTLILVIMLSKIV